MQGTEQDAVVEASPATTDGGAAEIEVNAEMPPPRKRRRRRGRGNGGGAPDPAGGSGGAPATDDANASADASAADTAADASDVEPDTDADGDTRVPEAAADERDPAADAVADDAATDDAATDEAVAEPAGRAGRADDAPCRHQSLAVLVEALLFSSDRPLTEARLADLVGLVGPRRAARVRGALDELDTMYRATGRSFRPRKIAGGWQLLTVPVLGPLMARLHRDRQERRLSTAALETLSIVAYRQPVVRAELEAIRGVACGEVLRSLMEKRLIRVVGRAEELGRPLLYGTTRQFLEVFGLSSLDELPDVIGLERKPSTILRKDTPAGEDGSSESDAAQNAGGKEPSGDAATTREDATTDASGASGASEASASDPSASSDDASPDDASPEHAAADEADEAAAGEDAPVPVVEVESGLRPPGDAATPAAEKAGAE